MVEPKMSYAKFPCNWFTKLSYKPFAFNIIPQPYLLCVCYKNINLVIPESTNELVAFTSNVDNTLLAFAAVYASNNLYKRKDLWNDLQYLQTNNLLP